MPQMMDLDWPDAVVVADAPERPDQVPGLNWQAAAGREDQPGVGRYRKWQAQVIVANNCLVRYISVAVGGRAILEVVSRAAVAQAGPGMAASKSENIPLGGSIRRAAHLEPYRRGA